MMGGLNIPVLSSWIEAGLFAASGLLNILLPPYLRRVFEEFDAPPRFYRTAGFVQIALALAFIAPALKIWVLFAGGAVLMHAGVLLLDHRRYPLFAVVVAMLALLFVSSARIPAEYSAFSQGAIGSLSFPAR
jgi:DoxX-like family